MFRYKKGKLFCEDVEVQKIQIPTPFYLYSKNQILRNFFEFKNALRKIDHLICFAMKANSNQTICRLLFENGAGADVTSLGELYRAIIAGCDPKKIVYAGVGKKVEEIEFALKKGILMFNVESISELKLIDEVSKRMRKIAPVAIRVNLNIDPHTHKYITTGKYENKFGIYENDLKEAISLLKNLKNLQFLGLHSHIGSQITQVGPFIEMAKRLSKLIKDMNLKIKYINLGGGLGIRYKDESPPKPKQLVESVTPYFKGKKIIFEPGRYIVGNAGVIITTVLYRKSSPHKKFVIVDAGMDEIIRPPLYDAYHEIIPLVKQRKKREIVDVVGPICETSDFIGRERMLPALEPGEKLAVLCAGAYCSSMGSNYNSRLKPYEIMVDKKRWYVIRERESLMDLIRREAPVAQ